MSEFIFTFPVDDLLGAGEVQEQSLLSIASLLCLFCSH